MRLAIFLSVLLHLGILVWILGPFTTARPFKKEQDKTVSVGMISASEFSSMKKGLASAKQSDKQGGLNKKKSEKKKPEDKAKKKAEKVRKPKAVLAPKPAEKDVIAKPVKKEVKAKPKPKPKPVKKVTKPKPKPKPKKLVKKKPVKKQVKKAQRKNKSKPKKFDPNNIAALLNKLPDAEPSLSPVEEWKRTTPNRQARRYEDEEAFYGEEYGQDEKVTMSEIDAFKAQIAECWSPPTAGVGADRIVVSLLLTFKKTGHLADLPRLKNYSSSPITQAVADSAIRAVMQCQPYKLPAHKYNTWKEMVLNFDPRDMY